MVVPIWCHCIRWCVHYLWSQSRLVCPQGNGIQDFNLIDYLHFRVYIYSSMFSIKWRNCTLEYSSRYCVRIRWTICRCDIICIPLYKWCVVISLSIIENIFTCKWCNIFNCAFSNWEIESRCFMTMSRNCISLLFCLISSQLMNQM